MVLHSYAPSTKPPPLLYVRWTWAKEMGVPWDHCGIQDSEIPHLAQLINIKQNAEGLRSKKGKGTKSAMPGMPQTI